MGDLGNGECRSCSNLRFDAGYMELDTLLAPPECCLSGTGFLCEVSRRDDDLETEERPSSIVYAFSVLRTCFSSLCPCLLAIISAFRSR